MVYIISNKKYPIFISSSIRKYSCTVMPVYNSKYKIVQLKVSYVPLHVTALFKGNTHVLLSV